ncbi:CID4, partial [Symbiodinium sp. CCMP2456]
MAYRSLPSAHPLAFHTGASSSGDQPQPLLLEQSPARSKAPSDPPSDFSSWHDDASSSLAPSGTARDGTITVNPLVMRMGEHLKGKLQGMIRQRFENYIHITKTLQNDIGKLAVLTCELRTTVRIAAAAADCASLDKVRVSISCNEDGTFLVYTMPDAAGTLGSRCSSPASSSSQAPQEIPSEAVQPVIPVEAITEEVGAEHVLNNWVQKVCEFGMSGRCHSLTALFHFGYTAWKQSMHSSLQSEHWGMESVEDISPGHIAEEEEKQSQVLFKEEPPFEPNVMHGGSASSSCNGSVQVDDAERSPEQLLTCARLAADSERLRQALEFCTEGLDLLWGELCLCPVLAEPCAASRASSSSLAPDPAAVWRPGGSDKVFVPDETVTTLSGLLCLRASAHAQLQQYVEALSDADELTGLQPTSADGYYWQSVALQGMGREHEALEALMSALEYEPQNAFYQQLLTALFEDISDRDTLKRRPGRRESSR